MTLERRKHALSSNYKMKSAKEIIIESRTYYFFDDIININKYKYIYNKY